MFHSLNKTQMTYFSIYSFTYEPFNTYGFLGLYVSFIVVYAVYFYVYIINDILLCLVNYFNGQVTMCGYVVTLNRERRDLCLIVP